LQHDTNEKQKKTDKRIFRSRAFFLVLMLLILENLHRFVSLCAVLTVVRIISIELF